MVDVTSRLATLTPAGWDVKDGDQETFEGGVGQLSASDAELVKALVLDGVVPGNTFAAIREARALRLKQTMQFPGPTLFFDFSEQTGSVIYDRLSQRAATLNAGSVSWTTRGVLFNGSGAFQFASGVMDGLCGTVCDLSTLGTDDAITIAMVYHHSATLSGQHPLFYYGCSGENTCGGWGILARTNGKLYFYHRAAGSSTEDSRSLNNRDPGNAAANNTRSAVCIEIRRNPDDPNYFEVALADRPLEASAEVNSTGFSFNGGMRLKGDGTGTGPAKYSTLGPLTIGGQPNATYTSLAKVAGASSAYIGLQLLAIQRYRYVPGRFHAILQDLAADQTTPPTSLFMEA